MAESLEVKTRFLGGGIVTQRDTIGTGVDHGPAEPSMGRRDLLRLAGIMAGGALSLTVSRAALAAARAKPYRSVQRIVVIDPGHGGIDPGCIGYSGTYEKRIVFSTANEIARLLEATGRYRPILTRRTDQFIPLQGRVAFARAVHGDVFVSVHADAIPNRQVRGASVFTLSENASDSAAAALAARENGADMVGGIDLGSQSPEVSNILLDLARRQTNNLSVSFARELVSKLGSEVRLLEHSHRSAGFAVLKAPDIPSVLVETGCLSNRDEERLLCSPTYRHRLAVGVAQSIDSYFSDVVRA